MEEISFLKLKELNELLSKINNDIKEEEKLLCEQSLKEKKINIGDKILYKGYELFLDRVYVKNMGYPTFNFMVCFEAKKVKKDGTKSLHGNYLYHPQFSLVEKVKETHES